VISGKGHMSLVGCAAMFANFMTQEAIGGRLPRASHGLAMYALPLVGRPDAASHERHVQLNHRAGSDASKGLIPCSPRVYLVICCNLKCFGNYPKHLTIFFFSIIYIYYYI
jgi:hypothetical protein